MTVYAFPSARHAKMVDTIGRGMAAAGSMDDAEEYLIEFLEIHWDRFESFGVDCDEIDRECRLFARAAWAHYQELQQEEGAA